MRSILLTGIVAAAGLCLTACGDATNAPAEPTTEELPVEEVPVEPEGDAAMSSDASAPAAGDAATAADAAAPADSAGDAPPAP